MKRFGMLFSAAAGLVVMSPAAHAQRFEVGAKIGLNYSSVSVSPEDIEVSSLSGVGTGVFARLNPGGMGVQAEVLYMRKGAESSDDDGGELRLNYFEIPVTFVVPFGGGPATGFAFAGPSFAFEASCSLRSTTAQDAEAVDCDEPGLDIFERKTSDIGVVVGGGLRVAAGIGALIVDARYTVGLTNLVDEAAADESIKNRTFTVMVGYGIGLGR